MNNEKLRAIVDRSLEEVVPFIEDLGNGLYQVNGNNKFKFITNAAGAKEAIEALKNVVNNETNK